MRKLFAVILSLSLIIGPMPAAYASGGGGIAKQVLGIANGVIGASVITKCKLASSQISLLLYMAGSIVFVAAEVAGGKKKTKDVEDQAQSLDELKAGMKEGGDYQMAAIDAQIKNEKSNLEFIQKRRKWMMATKAIYAAATAMAVMEVIWQNTPPVFKPWEGGCTPDASHTPIVAAIALAYGAAMSSGGTLKGMAIGVALGAAVKVILPMIGIGADIANMAVTALGQAPARIAFFAAATALVMVIDAELADEEKKSQDKIAQLEKLKESFKQASQADNALAEGSSNQNLEGSDANDPSKKSYEIKGLAKGSELQKQCFAKVDGAMHYSADACKSSFKLTRPKFEANMNIPTLKAVSNLATDMGQAVADGDSAKADVAAGELANMAGRMDAVKDGLMKKLNDQLKKEGKKPIDVNGELKRQIAALNDGLNKKNPGSGNFSLASLGSPSSTPANSGGEATLAAVDPNAGNVDIKAPEVPAAAVTTVNTDLSSISEDSLGVANAEEALGILGAKKMEETVANFTGAEGDISKESDVSIFKQVSNRYFLNYTKIFNRKEINPPMAEPAPSN